MKIIVSGVLPTICEDGLYLIKDSWDDWFVFETTYNVQLINDGKKYYLGSIKIGDELSTEKFKDIYGEYDQGLPDYTFSLGTDEDFYSELNRDEIAKFREEILIDLNDIAFNEKKFEQARNTYVFQRSLSRGMTINYIQERLTKLAHGDVELTNYDFSFSTQGIQDMFNPIDISFSVVPYSVPPTNIHALIGRNGVGKSFVLSLMIKSLVEKDLGIRSFGEFSNLLSVNFSSFEDKEIFEDNEDSEKGIIYHHIGSTMFIGDKKKHLSPDDLTDVFFNSLTICLTRKPRSWAECVGILYSDPVFASLDILGLASNYRSTSFEEYKAMSKKLYNQLSSGHKVVLLTICKLVELTSEKTLLIMDEPELHLHPPLLSSLIRSISYLLEKVNGVAIIATHSPIVLQETPKSCVWILNRVGSFMKADRPIQETFGEDVSGLTREVFSFEVTNSGFYSYLKKSVETGNSYEQILETYSNQLSTGGKSILRNLVFSRDRSIEDE